MGYGGSTHDGGRLTDSIMVVRIEPHNQRVTIISIPRDLWVNLPTDGDTTSGYKINAAYAIGNDDENYPNKKIEFTGPAGGGEMSKYIVSKIVGFDIDYFVTLDFAGFTKVVNQLGGVNVKVERILDDQFYPIDIGTTDPCGKSPDEITALSATMSGDKLEQQFACRYEHLRFGVGTTHMDGATALKYVRSRHGAIDGNDFNRAARQRNFLLAVKDKVLSFNLIPKIIPIINTLSRNLQTDVDLAKMQELIATLPDISKYQITSIALTDQNVLKNDLVGKQMVLLPIGGEDNFIDIIQYISSSGTLLPTLTPVPTLYRRSTSVPIAN